MKIEELIQKLEEEKEQHEMYEKATDADIDKTESAIGQKLPQSYKTFVTSFSNGAYLYTMQEVSAVGDGNEQIIPIQAVEWLDPVYTDKNPIPFRGGGEVAPENLVPFGLDHNANAWCFVLDPNAPEAECPVAYLHISGRKLYGKLDNFAKWVEILIEEQSEVIRVLYDEDVIYDELDLG